MKKKYRHIEFREHKEDGVAYTMHNRKTYDIMGYVYYETKWKKFILEFESGFIFDDTCLRDIAEFLLQCLDAKRKGKL